MRLIQFIVWASFSATKLNVDWSEAEHQLRIHCFQMTIPVYKTEPLKFDQRGLLHEQQGYVTWCEAEMRRLQRELDSAQQLVEHWKKQYFDLIETQLEESRQEQEQFDKASQDKGKAMKEICVLIPKATQKLCTTTATAETPMKPVKKNHLYNLLAEIRITTCQPFKLRAILDTGASTCCVDTKATPAEAIEENPYKVYFTGINSKTTATKKLREDSMLIGANYFRIPYTYAFDMNLGDKIQMILGCNFIRSDTSTLSPLCTLVPPGLCFCLLLVTNSTANLDEMSLYYLLGESKRSHEDVLHDETTSKQSSLSTNYLMFLFKYVMALSGGPFN